MSSLTLSKRSLFPTWTNDLLDTGNFFQPSLLDFDGDFDKLDFGARMPSVNVIENEKEYKIEMAAPGLQRKDFKINVEKEMLVISSEIKEEKKEKTDNYTRREFSYNSFKRSFRLPQNCNMDKIDAKYEDGILKIVLPKKEVTVAKPAKEIKVG